MKHIISVSFRGVHVFETNPDRDYTPSELDLILKMFQGKFKKDDGFEVSVTVIVTERSFYKSINEYMQRTRKAAPGRE